VKEGDQKKIYNPEVIEARQPVASATLAAGAGNVFVNAY